MPRFTVYEVQLETAWRRWSYEVEAATPEEALKVVENGDGEPIDRGQMGDFDYGDGGWAVRPTADELDDDAWQEAVTSLTGRPACPAATMPGPS